MVVRYKLYIVLYLRVSIEEEGIHLIQKVGEKRESSARVFRQAQPCRFDCSQSLNRWIIVIFVQQLQDIFIYILNGGDRFLTSESLPFSIRQCVEILGKLVLPVSVYLQSKSFYIRASYRRCLCIVGPPLNEHKRC